MDMMTRRRAMMGERAGSEWDYEWDYTMGLPTDYGWTRTGSALSSNTKFELQDEYLQMYVSGNAYNQQLNAPGSENPVGVLEAVIGVSSLSNYQLSYLCFSDGDTFGLTLRFQYSKNYKGIYLADDSSGLANYSKLHSFTSSNRSDYNTIRLESDGTNGAVYINGALKKSFALSTMISTLRKTQVYLSSVSSGNSKSEIHLKSLKLKRGRV